MEQYAKNELVYNGMIDQKGNTIAEGETGLIVDMVKAFFGSYYSEKYNSIDKSIAIDVFLRLIKNIPITPLTGEDSEWVDIGEDNLSLWRNIRCGTVLKDENGAWDTNVFINWSWTVDPAFNDGKPFKMYFIAENQRTPVKFPYAKEHELKPIFVPTEQFPNEEI